MNPEFDDDQHRDEVHALTPHDVADFETGDSRIDAVLAALHTLPELPTAEHVGAFDEVHRGLQDALATLTEA
ncbi:MAG: hypothetical protein ACT4PP_07675 [Sporichthyaceae bacterium]